MWITYEFTGLNFKGVFIGRYIKNIHTRLYFKFGYVYTKDHQSSLFPPSWHLRTCLWMTNLKLKYCLIIRYITQKAIELQLIWKTTTKLYRVFLAHANCNFFFFFFKFRHTSYIIKYSPIKLKFFSGIVPFYAHINVGWKSPNPHVIFKSFLLLPCSC